MASVVAKCAIRCSGNGTYDIVFLYTAIFWRLGVVSVLGFDSSFTLNAGAESFKPARGRHADFVKYMICSLQVFKQTRLTAHYPQL